MPWMSTGSGPLPRCGRTRGCRAADLAGGHICHELTVHRSMSRVTGRAGPATARAGAEGALRRIVHGQAEHGVQGLAASRRRRSSASEISGQRSSGGPRPRTASRPPPRTAHVGAGDAVGVPARLPATSSAWRTECPARASSPLTRARVGGDLLVAPVAERAHDPGLLGALEQLGVAGPPALGELLGADRLGRLVAVGARGARVKRRAAMLEPVLSSSRRSARAGSRRPAARGSARSARRARRRRSPCGRARRAAGAARATGARGHCAGHARALRELRRSSGRRRPRCGEPRAGHGSRAHPPPRRRARGRGRELPVGRDDPHPAGTAPSSSRRTISSSAASRPRRARDHDLDPAAAASELRRAGVEHHGDGLALALRGALERAISTAAAPSQVAPPASGQEPITLKASTSQRHARRLSRAQTARHRRRPGHNVPTRLALLITGPARRLTPAAPQTDVLRLARGAARRRGHRRARGQPEVPAGHPHGGRGRPRRAGRWSSARHPHRLPQAQGRLGEATRRELRGGRTSVAEDRRRDSSPSRGRADAPAPWPGHEQRRRAPRAARAAGGPSRNCGHGTPARRTRRARPARAGSAARARAAAARARPRPAPRAGTSDPTADTPPAVTMLKSDPRRRPRPSARRCRPARARAAAAAEPHLHVARPTAGRSGPPRGPGPRAGGDSDRARGSVSPDVRTPVTRPAAC